MEQENKSSEGGSMTIKKITLWQIATFVFLGLFVVSLFTGGFGLKNSNSPPGTGNVVAPTGEPGPTGNVKVSVTNADPLLGDKNAEITMVEFSDFQCPFCKRANDDALAQFKSSDYFKKGQVNLVFKNFPLNSIHPFAQKAAEAAE